MPTLRRLARGTLAALSITATLTMPLGLRWLFDLPRTEGALRAGLTALLPPGLLGALGTGLLSLGWPHLTIWLRWPHELLDAISDLPTLGIGAGLALATALVAAPGLALAEGALVSPLASRRRRWVARGTLAAGLLALLWAPALRADPRLLPLLGLTSLLLVAGGALAPRAASLLSALGLTLALLLVTSLTAHAFERLPPGRQAVVRVEPDRVLRRHGPLPRPLRPDPSWRAPAPVPRRAQRVILVTIDTLRADHVSAIHPGRETTPHLDAFFEREGVVFTRAYSAAPWTLPSTTSLLTSLWPPQHGVESEQKLSRTVPTLAAAFSSQGFYAAAFVTHIYASARFGLDSGFDEFHELSIDQGFGEGHQPRAGAVRRRVRRWLEAHRDEPFFLYVHLFDPHWDYEPPPPFDRRFTDPGYRGPVDGTWHTLEPYDRPQAPMPPADLRQAIALYDGEIAYTDTELSGLFSDLRSLGLDEDTAIFVVADHGEEFKEHGRLGHQHSVYEELLRIPILFRPPGGRGADMPARVATRVRNLDVAPTALQAAGLRIPPSFEGESLYPLLGAAAGSDARRDRPVYARVHRGTLHHTALILGSEKVIRDGHGHGARLRLFDLAADPAERAPLGRTRPKDFSEMLDRLTAFEARLERRGQEAPTTVHLSAEEEAAIRALGYVQ